jgi:hypothetical protein
MPSKKKDSKSGQPSASWEKPDDVLQAVVLADSFNYRFLPITLEKPRVCLWVNRLYGHRFICCVCRYYQVTNRGCCML